MGFPLQPLRLKNSLYLCMYMHAYAFIIYHYCYSKMNLILIHRGMKSQVTKYNTGISYITHMNKRLIQTLPPLLSV